MDDAGLLALELDDDAFFELAAPDAIERVEATRGLVPVAGRTFAVAAASRHERGVRREPRHGRGPPAIVLGGPKAAARRRTGRGD